MTDVLISAIVSTYNSERFMRGCLEDLAQQTIGERTEVVVIDSASPQREGEIVREFQERMPNLRYIRTDEREDMYAAWNRGILAARGKYLTSANTDDRHRRDAFEILTSALERDPSAALAYADVLVSTHENDTFETVNPYAYYRWPKFDRQRLFRVGYCGPQPVWRRSLHDTYGLFDTSFVSAGDYEWWLRIGRGERFVHVPEILGIYYANPNSVEHRNAAINWRESELARERHWQPEWGRRPHPHGFFLRFDPKIVMRSMMHGDFEPLRAMAAHAKMMLGLRKGRYTPRS
jgi:glycosyltransferase involved in cell wall biosynthesis